MGGITVVPRRIRSTRAFGHVPLQSVLNYNEKLGSSRAELPHWKLDPVFLRPTSEMSSVEGWALLRWNRIGCISSQGSGRRTLKDLQIKSDSFLVLRQKEMVVPEVHGSGSKRT